MSIHKNICVTFKRRIHAWVSRVLIVAVSIPFLYRIFNALETGFIMSNGYKYTATHSQYCVAIAYSALWFLALLLYSVFCIKVDTEKE